MRDVIDSTKDVLAKLGVSFLFNHVSFMFVGAVLCRSLSHHWQKVLSVNLLPVRDKKRFVWSVMGGDIGVSILS